MKSQKSKRIFPLRPYRSWRQSWSLGRRAVLCLGLVMALLAAGTAGAVTYGPPVKLSTTPVNTLDALSGTVPINNKGQVVWYGTDNNNNSQLYLYDGSVTKPIKNSTNCLVNEAVINDNGWVAWTAHVAPSNFNTNVWAYGNGAYHQITADGGSTLGGLNNSNGIVYDDSPYATGTGYYGVFQYPGNIMVSGKGQSPRLNNKGQIIYIDPNNQLHLYSGGSDKVISTPVYGSYAINDAGQIAWESWGSNAFQTQIYLYSGGITKTVVNNACENDFYGRGMFNARGGIVWLGWSGAGTGTYDIYLYSGGVTKPITTNGDVGCPNINDNGQIVWAGTDSSNHSHIYLYSGGVTQPVVDVVVHSQCTPVINNLGQIAYVDQNDCQVYLVSPVGLKIKKPLISMLNLLLGN